MSLTRRDFLSLSAKLLAGGVAVASGILGIVPKPVWLATPEPQLSPEEARAFGQDTMEGIADGIKAPGGRFKPMKFYCPNCWRGSGNGDIDRKAFTAYFMLGWGFGTVVCSDCNTQWCILRAGETARVINPEYVYASVFFCDYACENNGLYGFVPEYGCPIHDPDTTNLLNCVSIRKEV